MTVTNPEIAKLLSRVARLMALAGENPYKIRAYENGARTVNELLTPVDELIASGRKLTDLPGIGEGLSKAITEALATGSLSQAAELEGSIAAPLLALYDDTGLEPDVARKLFERHGVQSVGDLRRELEAGTLKKLGAKTLRSITEALAGGPSRILLSEADRVVAGAFAALGLDLRSPLLAVTGEVRRRVETIGEARLLARESFYEEARRGLDGRFDVKISPASDRDWGAALLRNTGNEAHVAALERLASERGLRFEGEEEEIYSALGLPFIPPELREGIDEVGAAARGVLPELITVGDVKGDLHAHTDASDGAHSLEEMARAAMARGYRYLAVTDHSQRLKIARGLSPERLAAQIDEIDRLNEIFSGFRLLKSSEVDILDDGSLDYPDELLARLDFAVCSVHSRFNLPPEKQTERLLKAIRNPYCAVIGHPTGRLLLDREGYKFDVEQVFKAAADAGCLLEINANPHRLDLSDSHVRLARSLGIKITISTDAHHANELDNMRYGIGQARRGMLSAAEVVNTRGLDEALGLLRWRRSAGTRT